MSPPMASNDSAMSRALRVFVPLNSRCSRKCDEPLIRGSSSREPVCTQNPRATERTPGIRSVTTRRPDSNSVRRIGTLLPAGRAVPVPVPSVAVAGTAVTPLPLAVLRLRPLGYLPLLADGLEVDLAHGVDLLDLDLELVALLDGVLDAVEALALPELRDVHEPVAAGDEVHERAERGRLHHGPVVPLADEHRPRVRDVVDHARGLVRAGALAGADEDGAVVLDIDIGAGHRDDLVDPLALRADHL